MGFEVHFFSFKNGEPVGFPIERIREAFSPYVTESKFYAWELVYGGELNGGVNIFPHPSDPTLLHGFVVDRPGVDPRMWETLADILAFGPFALIFSSKHPPMIGNADVARHLPPDMIESMGQPKLVSSGREISDNIRSS
jgi:hypothetical protein